MYAYDYIVILRPDTSAEARNRRPAGDRPISPAGSHL
jgi:hypothetical protein